MENWNGKFSDMFKKELKIVSTSLPLNISSHVS
jgi:hypothetical protein